ncbi:radical SAM family heme chaperone HemW [Paenibacillus sacheonensis]|uniref:Heme chaperone HemW n=1 Tax=Paenibacillus sacheonensis TaxID=742054 RepID=A0A7X4YQ09_9BACL|nr:radical SAM family heme chaperone HemW [Paenibacillus sacheonensis]MBM7565618.1 oxygen-independent coproporphyrinogen-3 oxidase [Paenibacillus sacheonensis]NBC69464.1 oxygen-independent coproporphyrinogen III oxidase [Paenibacillus sacheonensis]
MLTHAPRALYIHIPFCTNKCHYCDFTSYVLKGQPVDAYLDALELEMARTVEALPPEEIRTVFVGGGTPTVLTPPQMERFLSSVKRYFPIHPDAEFTMEANPGTTDLEKLQAMQAGGVNRISMGVQSFDNGLLERIGRIHNVDDVYRSIENARTAGVHNLSIDLMFGLPGQTVDQLSDSVAKALALELPHYSLYGLKVEENTLFHALYERNELPLPPEEDELAMYMLLIDRLTGAGYDHYEISNFAKPGFESRHNITYWRNEPYYGLGAGAHGYARGERHVNIKGIQPFLDAAAERLPRLETNAVSEEEAMEEFMMVGLRMLRGVRNGDFAAQFPGRTIEDAFGEPLRRLLKQGLLETVEGHGGGYRLSKQGIPLGNEVFGAFIS